MATAKRLSARVRRRRTIVALAGASLVVVASCAVSHSGTAARTLLPAAAQALPTDHGQDSAPGHTTSAAGAAVYAHTGVGQFVPATRGVPYLLYVPESAGRSVDVVDPVHLKVVGRYATGLDPQHVVPSYDLKTLWSTNDLAGTLTPFDPRTGRPKGPNVAVDEPYNMYFTPGGREAIVIAEQRQRLEFYDAQTFSPTAVVNVDCAGVDHADFDMQERTMVASCEFAGRLLRLDLATKKVTGYLDLPGSSPQDVRLSPDGSVFFVADKLLGGVHVIDAARFVELSFVRTGRDAHGIYPSRNGRVMYVSNRGSGTISVLDPRQRRVLATWRLPMGGSPDMGGVSPDGSVLWLSGRYDATLYEISTRDGHLVGQVHVPNKPHGMCVWPQPGRYSLGHTGNLR